MDIILEKKNGKQRAIIKKTGRTLDPAFDACMIEFYEDNRFLSRVFVSNEDEAMKIVETTLFPKGNAKFLVE